MSDYGGDAGAPVTADGLKRKRSSSPERPLSMSAPPAKVSKSQPGASIDFLAALPADDPLQLVDIDDSLRFIQQHLEQYSGAIERHESLAANLGARLQAPNTIRRFERMFMHPMKILANHGKESNTVTWLDIVRFYEDKPNQMKLHPKDGELVCQFYTKQCRVEITEDEFEFIRSGQPQKMLPSGTVPADEEKELGTIEFMEQKISQIIKLADQVSGRGKVLMTRLKARRNALAVKREEQVNGMGPTQDAQQTDNRSASPVGGFTAINAQAKDSSLNGITTTSAMSRPLVSSAVRQELSQIFAGNRDRLGLTNPEYTRSHKSRNRGADIDVTSAPVDTTKPVPTAPPTPGLNPTNHRPSPAEKVDNDGPFKAEMLSRMDKMPRYTVVKPPCDRCRRLQIDCQKNLTACLGCTRKHAKCSWKDVTDQELRDHPPLLLSHVDLGRRDSLAGSNGGSEENGPPLPVRDEELLGEDDSEDEAVSATAQPGPSKDQDDGPNEVPTASMSSPNGQAGLTQPITAGFNASGSIGANAAASGPLSPTGLTPASYDLNRALSHQNSNAMALNTSLPPSAAHDSSNFSHPFPNHYMHPAQPEKSSQSNVSNLSSIKLDHSSQHSSGNSQALPRLPSFPTMLGDRMIDNPALLGTATGDRLARDAQDQISRMQPDSENTYPQPQQQQHGASHQEGSAAMHGHPPGMTNGMAKV